MQGRMHTTAVREALALAECKPSINPAKHLFLFYLKYVCLVFINQL